MAAPAADDAAAASLAESVHVAQKVGKRKRSAEAESPAHTQPARDSVDEHSRQVFEDFLTDLSTLLKQHDPSPSILQQSLQSNQDATPSAKRTKLSSRLPPADTVQSKITSSKYNDIEELSSDITAAVAAASTDADDLTIVKLQAFEHLYKDTIERQSRQEPDSLIRPSQKVEEEVDDGLIDPKLSVLSANGSNLILQSIGPGGRPYFSSIQLADDATTSSSESTKDKEALETVLPKTVSVAAVGTVQGYDSKSKDQHIPTLGEICPPPKRLPPYKTPQDSSRSTTRGTIVGWYKSPQFAPSQPRGEGRVSYSKQRLSVGAWLTTNNPPPPPNDTVNERRRQRDRALSAGTQRVEQTADELAEARAAQERYRRRKDMSLFKSVYSSFAPTFDNSKSVIPQEVTGRMWWNKKYGIDSRYGDALSETDDEMDVDVPTTGDDLDEAALADMVENFVEEDWSPANMTPEIVSTGDEAVDDLLRGISAMLETLSSYQRRRHSALKASSRPALAEIIGTPSTPAASEVEMHAKLRDQLTTVISMLPPYAVARLNGDQLSDLNIKTSIPVETVMHKGLLDEETRRATQVTAAASTSLRPQAPSARSSFPNAVGSSALRNSVSTPRQAPAWNAVRPVQTPSASYSSYQPNQSGAAQRSSYQFVQTPAPARHASQANGIRQSLGQSTFAAHGPSTGSPMPLQGSQPQRPPQPNFAPRPPQAATHTPNHGSQGSPQPSRQSYGAAKQISPQRQQHNPASSHPDSSSMSNGVGTIGYHIQLSTDERAKLMDSGEGQQHDDATGATTEQRESTLKGTTATPSNPIEATPLANGYSPNRPKTADRPIKTEVARAASPTPIKEPAPAQVNGETLAAAT